MYSTIFSMYLIMKKYDSKFRQGRIKWEFFLILFFFADGNIFQKQKYFSHRRGSTLTEKKGQKTRELKERRRIP